MSVPKLKFAFDGFYAESSEPVVLMPFSPELPKPVIRPLKRTPQPEPKKKIKLRLVLDGLIPEEKPEHVHKPARRVQVPANIEEFVELGYLKKIRYRINAFNLHDSLNNPDDLESDILLSLIETNYIGRYDATKAAFSTYLYVFVDNFLKKRFNRENTKNGKYITTAARLESSTPDAASAWDGHTIYADYISSEQDFTQKVLIEETVSRIAEELKDIDMKFPASVTEIPDLCTVLNLMLNDKDVKTIACILSVPRQVVNTIIKTIRSTQAFRQFKHFMSEVDVLSFNQKHPTSKTV